MVEDEAQQPASAATSPASAPPRRPLPQGYRQGLITAITVLLGFSLSFLRFWGFEAPGEWTVRSAAAAGAIGIAVLMQIRALARSLRLSDDDEPEFTTTARWLFSSALVLLVGVALALLIDSGLLGGKLPGPRP
jgi:hypothetical protein